MLPLEEIQRKKQTRYVLIFIIFAAMLVVIFLFSVALGSVQIRVMDVVKIVFQQEGLDFIQSSIVRDIRLPRALAAVVGGAALSMAGLLLQIYFQNPIVDPFVLGVSSGAALMVGIVTLTGTRFGITSQSTSVIFVAAMTGSMVVMAIITGVAAKVKNIIMLLVIGLMVGYLGGAVISILVTFAEKENIRNFVVWSMGSFAGFTWNRVTLLTLTTVPVLLAVFLVSKQLNALLMGERYAQSMGVQIKRIRLLVVVLSSLLTGMVTAYAGPVAFIGLAVPHMARLLFGTTDNRVLIPAVIVIGGMITAACDLLARLLFAPVELPISAVTSFIGAPIVIYLLTRRTSL
ncbi:MAG: iron ABC transporter permease [Firmicutes bacterium]|nr:iron ABC transporter permease [Bacillota bacterium]